MEQYKSEILPGTLNLMVLRTLSACREHPARQVLLDYMRWEEAAYC